MTESARPGGGVGQVIDISDWVSGWPVEVASVGVTSARTTLAVGGDVTRVGRVASVAKPVSALAILVALEEGSVSLDDPVGPQGSTLRHLLAHASGLAFDSDEVLAPAGTRRIYSNTGIEAAAAHVAARAAMPFAQYLYEAVFEPLHLASTSLPGSPASGMYSDVTDLLAVARELLAPTLIAQATMAEARTVQFPELAGVLPAVGRFDPNPWGLGLEIKGHKHPHWTGASNSPATYGHFGGSGAFVWVDPIHDLGAVAITGREFGGWALEVWPAFDDRVIAEFSPRQRVR
jgi:CubicO group peptidase (beta-lactamase class C family)